MAAVRLPSSSLLRTHSLRPTALNPRVASASSASSSLSYSDRDGGQRSGVGATEKLLVVDGTALAFRSHYAFTSAYNRGMVGGNGSDTSHRMLGPLRSSVTGEETGALLGFMRQLLRLMNDEQEGKWAVDGEGGHERRLGLGGPFSHVVVAFDARGKNFRHALFPQYKANRPDEEPPEGILTCIRRARDILGTMEVPTVAVRGVEADDVIGTICTAGIRRGLKVQILSHDKDFMQLLSNVPSVSLLKIERGGSGIVEYAHRHFVEDYGVSPKLFVDILALMGDSSDNIPGIKGCGPKIATRLVNRYGSMDAIMKNVEEVKPKNVRASLMADDAEELLKTYRELVTLKTDVKEVFDVVDPRFKNCLLRKPGDCGDATFALFEDLEFYSLMDPLTRWLERVERMEMESERVG